MKNNDKRRDCFKLVKGSNIMKFYQNIRSCCQGKLWPAKIISLLEHTLVLTCGCSIRARALDLGGEFNDVLVTITITNVNEAPTSLTLSGFRFDENVYPAVVGRITGVDPEMDSLTYSLQVFSCLRWIILISFNTSFLKTPTLY
jgi:hypothetical protein